MSEELSAVLVNKKMLVDNKNDRVYREDNKEYLKLQKGLKFDCECGGRFTNCHKQEHLRSKKHQDYLQNIRTS